MNLKGKRATSGIFDVSKFVNTQVFTVDSDQNNLSSSLNNVSDHYLWLSIGEPLSYALAYVVIYRPEDSIEFIANYLINWSRNKTYQKLINQETNNKLTSIETYQQQCFINEQKKIEAKRLLIERKEKQQQEIVYEYNKRLFTSYQWDFYINPRTDDEREPCNHFEKQQIYQQIHTKNIQSYIHTHDTASGFDDEMMNNQENNKNRICHDGNLSSFTYLSKFKDKLIKCDEY
ncbi:unnamed protein product [Rotaria sp. Silwood1]|nr:unnamed protein product [Rotaria sp. Silwood1]CAF1207855.1 unnamed protein product [Rotaria sp. Silwood1]CAF3440455.1 unnamed protein product [Rotaria sp. Silwood1]CAF3480385.1 unnamed protein product [Rotaria sp. Silwood1]CAF3485189.1 unnamed protein product [Rotaria sp. Silwood1]